MTKPNVVNIPDAEALEREAAQWFVRFDAGDVCPDEMRIFQEWYGKSQQHRDAFERISSFWSGAEILGDLRDYAAADDVQEPLKRDIVPTGGKSRRLVLGSMAASITLLGGLAVTNLAINSSYNHSVHYETAIGEQKSISLPDDSQITLNTNSALQVSFSKDVRRIDMTNGEVLFDVAPDERRPFSVATNNGVVTAVGTAFSIRVHEEKIDVLVTEGRVALASTETEDNAEKTPAASVTELSAGQSVEFAQTARTIQIVREEEVEKALDWRDGMISFNGETLQEVITYLSRYTDLQIDIPDEALRQKKIVAYYRVGEIEPMLQALNLVAGVEIEHIDDNHVRLYQAKQ